MKGLVVSRLVVVKLDNVEFSLYKFLGSLSTVQPEYSDLVLGLIQRCIMIYSSAFPRSAGADVHSELARTGCGNACK